MAKSRSSILISIILGSIIFLESAPIGAAKHPLRPDTITITLISASPRYIPIFKMADSILTEMRIPKHRYTYLSTVYNVDIPSRFLPDELVTIFVYYSVVAPPFNMDYITKYNGRKYIIKKKNGDFLVDNFGKKIQLKLSDYDTLLFLDRLYCPVVLVIKTNGDIVVVKEDDDNYIQFVE